MYKAAIGALALWSSIATAEVFTLNLYAPDFVNDGVSDFFTDYDFLSRCTVEIDDSALLPRSPPPFIDINSVAFKRLECRIQGADRTYEFSYGSAVPVPDYWSGVKSPGIQLGLLFDSDGRPLRFDSPQISSQSSSYGFYDSAAEGFGGFSTHSFFGPMDDDNFNTPIAVLTEPAVIFGTLRPKGYMTSSATLPAGVKAALINGQFVFQEQWLRDEDRSAIPNPFNIRGYYSFDEKITTPKLRITQGVFHPGEGPIRLVHERTTAIIVGKGAFFNDRAIELAITDTTDSQHPILAFSADEDKFVAGEAAGQVVFYCNKSVQYCGMQDGHTYDVAVQLNNGNLFRQARTVLNQKTTRKFVLPFVGISSPLCGEPCRLTVASILPVVQSAGAFIADTYPLADDSLESTVTTLLGSNVVQRSYYAEGSCGGSRYLVFDAYWQDQARSVDLANLQGAKRVIGVVHPNYLTSVGFPPQVAGVTAYEFRSALGMVRLDTPPHAVAHELGHTFGLLDGYEADANCITTQQAPLATGFNVYAPPPQAFTTGIDFMGAGKLNPAWISVANWEQLYTEVSKSLPDPQVLVVSAFFNSSGEMELRPWIETTNVPDAADEGGPYRIQLLDQAGLVLQETPFRTNFKYSVDPLGTFLFERTLVARAMIYPPQTARVRILDADANVLANVDPAINTLRGSLNRVPNECLRDRSGTQLQNALLALGALEQAIATRQTNSIAAALRPFDELAASGLDDSCHPAGLIYIYRSIQELGDAIKTNLTRIRARHGITTDALPGDLDHDGDVDRNDVEIVTAARNQLAAGANDLRDLDRDGRITVLDARKLTLLCTRPNCAVQ